MAKNQRTRSRKASRRQKASRRSRRSCKAVYSNRQSFGQRGGMAPIAHGSSLLLEGAARELAGVSGYDAYFNDLPKGQQGGSRTRKQKRSQKRSNRKSHRKQSQRRSQRGGMAPFGWSGLTELKGVNPQFSDEGAVNPMYGEQKGAQ